MKRAFSLVEVSVVIVVIGLLIRMGLGMSGEFVESAARKETAARLAQIEMALATYVKTYGRLPCPAGRTAAENSAGYGLPPVICSNDTESDTVDTADTAAGLRIGVVPVKELSLPPSYMFDGYGNRITYAVIKDLAVNSTDYAGYTTSNTDGVINVTDGSGNQLSYVSTRVIVPYILVSHGKDGKGAYTRAGAAKGGCSGSNIDVENCDNDINFIDTSINEGNVAAQYSDDIVRWKTKEALDVDAGKITITTGNGGTSSLPSCMANQTLTYNGSAWICENKYAGTLLGTYNLGCCTTGNVSLADYPGTTRLVAQGSCQGGGNSGTWAALYFIDSGGNILDSYNVCATGHTDYGNTVHGVQYEVPSQAVTVRATTTTNGGYTSSISINFMK